MPTDLVVFAGAIGFGLVLVCMLLASLMVQPYDHYSSASDAG